MNQSIKKKVLINQKKNQNLSKREPEDQFSFDRSFLNHSNFLRSISSEMRIEWAIIIHHILSQPSLRSVNQRPSFFFKNLNRSH